MWSAGRIDGPTFAFVHRWFGVIGAGAGDGDSSSERDDAEKERADREAPHRSRQFEDLEVLVVVKTVLACNTDLRGGELQKQQANIRFL